MPISIKKYFLYIDRSTPISIKNIFLIPTLLYPIWIKKYFPYTDRSMPILIKKNIFPYTDRSMPIWIKKYFLYKKMIKEIYY